MNFIIENRKKDKYFINILLIIWLFLFGFTSIASGINIDDTRMMSEPAISNRHIAFIYAEDLWIQDINGNSPRRLTINEGVESNPVFSPDGKLIAFSSEYNGNTDVYILPVEGGIPKRLTWHPSDDFVIGFVPDGSSVLFTSSRMPHYSQIYTVPVDGGYPAKLEIPNGYHASYSPDGQYMAYTPTPDAFTQWKKYRGGAVSRIWIFSFADNSVKEISKPEGGCNDTMPVWIDNCIYFISDREGEFNLYSYNIEDHQIDRLTSFRDFPVINIAGKGSKIILEQGGYLHIYEIRSKLLKRLVIGIATELPGLRPGFVSGNRHIRSADISPTGARAVFGFRGDIVTVPEKKGDYRNITETAGIHEKYPAWSPDGKYIAYFTDSSGEYELAVISQDGKGKAERFPLEGAGFYAFPKWSPDSKRIAYTDNSRSLYIIEIDNGKTVKISSDEMYTPGAFREIAGSWSPDSKWLSFTKVLNTHFKKIYLYSVDQDRSFPVTDGLSDASEPVFDPSGKYLFFFASTDAGPIVNWFDLSNSNMTMTRSIYLVTLQKETLSPFLKESDEEMPREEKRGKDNGNKDQRGENGDMDNEIRIDFEGIENRTVAFPVSAGSFYNLGVNREGEILYIYKSDPYSSGLLKIYDMKKKKEIEIMDMENYIISADGRKLLFTSSGRWSVTDAGPNAKSGAVNLKTEDILVKTEPFSEWSQILDEAWRINRDYFYDPGMHGADWESIKAKYSLFLPHLTCRSDLTRLIRWMCSELSVGHHYTGIWNPDNAGQIGIGLLGVDYSVENDRYRISKIYGGLNWDAELRSPVTEPGINIKEGEYLLAVNGKDIKADQNIYSFFENTAGRIIELTVGPCPDYKDSRVVKAVPVRQEHSLRHRDWVEGNLRRVTEASKGKVAYVYVPNTAGLGLKYFTRYFFPQADRKAVIIDERFNGGGMLADYYIDVLRRPYHCHWNFRYGNDLKTPSASIQGPKVMIINEMAVSGGDLLPFMFRKSRIGTLVGKRTFGALVGILGFPELMDGGFVTAPNLAIWTNEGFIVENAGISPDIEVEQWPAEVIRGNDPQLEKAIEIALKKLEEDAMAEPVRPPYPLRAR